MGTQTVKTPSVAIVMRTKDSAWVLPQTLKALFSQNFRSFSLYIVDSGSKDDTLKIARKFPCEIRGISAESYLPGAVLNESISNIPEEIIVFLNSDTVPLSPNTLQNLIAPFDSRSVAGCFVRQLPRPEAKSWVRRDYHNAFPPSPPKPAWLPLSLCMAAIRRSLWEKHPFQTNTWGSEDIEWGKWAEDSGFEVRYLPNACAMHSHNYTLRQLWARQFIEGEANAWIWKRSFTRKDALIRAIKASVDDLLYDFNPLLLPTHFLRRLMANCGYYSGYQLGKSRLNVSDFDSTVGQKVILKNYGNQ